MKFVQYTTVLVLEKMSLISSAWLILYKRSKVIQALCGEHYLTVEIITKLSYLEQLPEHA